MHLVLVSGCYTNNDIMLLYKQYNDCTNQMMRAMRASDVTGVGLLVDIVTVKPPNSGHHGSRAAMLSVVERLSLSRRLSWRPRPSMMDSVGVA